MRPLVPAVLACALVLLVGPGSLVAGASTLLQVVPDPDPLVAFAHATAEGTTGPLSRLTEGLDGPAWEALATGQDRLDAARAMSEGVAEAMDGDVRACDAAQPLPALAMPREVGAPEPSELESYLATLAAWRTAPEDLAWAEAACRAQQAVDLLG